MRQHMFCYAQERVLFVLFSTTLMLIDNIVIVNAAMLFYNECAHIYMFMPAAARQRILLRRAGTYSAKNIIATQPTVWRVAVLLILRKMRARSCHTSHGEERKKNIRAFSSFCWRFTSRRKRRAVPRTTIDEVSYSRRRHTVTFHFPSLS